MPYSREGSEIRIISDSLAILQKEQKDGSKDDPR